MLSTNLTFLRKTKGFTQSEMADFIGITGNTRWSDYERGKSNPPIDVLLIISDKFKISVDALIKEELTEVRFEELTNEVEKGTKGKVTGKVSGKVQPILEAKNALTDLPVSYGMPRFITVDSQGEENCLYVPVKARAGYLSGLTDPDFITSLPTYRLPGLNNGSYRIFEIDRHSMFPTFHDKDKAICRAETIDKIRDDRTYVLITKNDGILCKRLINRASQGVIICKSDNNHKGEYPPIVLDVSEILEVWYVTDKWTKQLPSPGEIYKRIIDLEADVIMMKQKLLKPQ